MIRWAVRTVLGLALLAILCAATYWAVNAFDEDLTAEARELLQPPVLAAAGDDNAWPVGHAFRDLPESKPLEGWLRWHALKEPPLGQASGMQPTLQWLLIMRAPLYSKYRKVRALPRYGETTWPTEPMVGLPLDTALIDGAGLALAEIALAGLDGRLEDAVAEIERESLYHRRVLAGSRTLLGKLLACAAIIRDMSMVSDLLDMHGEKLRPWRERLMRVASPLPREDLDLSAVFALEAHFTAQMLLKYRSVILKQNKAFNEYREHRVRAWEAFGYRPQATVNEFARRYAAYREVSKATYEKVWAGGSFPEPQSAPAKASWRLVNPTGDALLQNETFVGYRYEARARDISALVALVGLQVALTLDEQKRRAFFQQAGRDRVVVLDGPCKPRATFDPATSTIRYKPSDTTGAIGEFAKRFGGDFAVPAGPRRGAK